MKYWWLNGFVVAIMILLSGGTGYAQFDPTRPPYYQDPDVLVIRKKDIVVTAIIVSDARRVAVVNDQVVGVGDTIFGLKILDIDKNAVKFYGHEGYFSVPLFENVKKERSEAHS